MTFPLLLRLALLALFAAPASATMPADFEQVKFEQVSPLILSRDKAEAAELPAQKNTWPGLELFHNRLETYLSDNAAHAQMTALLRDPRMGQLEPETADDLRAKGATLTSTRDGMLPEARSLDAEDTSLAAERDRLRANKIKLDNRLADIDRQVADHNATCLPTHPPERHSWCLDNARRLNGVITQYNADVAVHNGAVERWKSAVASLQPRWDAFVQRVLAWESSVKALAQEAKNALEDPCLRRFSVALDPSNPQPLEPGGKQLAFQADVSFSGVVSLAVPACAVDFKWLVTGKIGKIAPDPSDPKRAILTTGDDEDDGSVAVEVTNRKNNKRVKIAAAVKVKEDADTRVRIQAQTGDHVIASRSIARKGRVTLYEGHQLLGEVYEALPQPERDNRVNAFVGAKQRMEQCAVAGGCSAPFEVPIYNNPREKPWGPRIDITIFKGTAFVNDPALK